MITIDEMKNKILPCPVCKSENIMIAYGHNEHGKEIWSLSCHSEKCPYPISVGGCHSREDAHYQWNKHSARLLIRALELACEKWNKHEQNEWEEVGFHPAMPPDFMSPADYLEQAQKELEK